MGTAILGWQGVVSNHECFEARWDLQINEPKKQPRVLMSLYWVTSSERLLCFPQNRDQFLIPEQTGVFRLLPASPKQCIPKEIFPSPAQLSGHLETQSEVWSNKKIMPRPVCPLMAPFHGVTWHFWSKVCVSLACTLPAMHTCFRWFTDELLTPFSVMYGFQWLFPIRRTWHCFFF